MENQISTQTPSTNSTPTSNDSFQLNVAPVEQTATTPVVQAPQESVAAAPSTEPIIAPAPAPATIEQTPAAVQAPLHIETQATAAPAPASPIAQSVSPQEVQDLLKADLSQLHLNPQIQREINSVKGISIVQIILISLLVITLAALGVVYGWSQGWIFQGSLSNISASEQVYTRTFPSESQATPDSAEKPVTPATPSDSVAPVAVPSTPDQLNSAAPATTTEVKKPRIKVSTANSAAQVTPKILADQAAASTTTEPKRYITTYQGVISTLSVELLSGINKLDALQIVADSIVSSGAQGLQVKPQVLTADLVKEPLLQRYQLALSFGVESGIISLEEAINWQKLKTENFQGAILLQALKQVPESQLQSWFE